MIGFVIALKNELPNLLKEFINFSVLKQNGYDIFIWKQHNHSACLIYSGVGKVNAAMATQTLINSCKVTNIINIGSCGAIKPNVHLNNVIIPKIVSYFDIDLTAFGYEPNRLPHLPVQFKIDQALIKKIRKILQPLNYKISHDELVTGETFINQNNFKNFKISKNAIVVDMEGAAIVQTCKHNNIPCVIIKIVSDSIFDKNKNEISWKNNILPISKIINQTFSSLVFKL